MEKIRAIIIDAKKANVYEGEITPELATYYKLIGCEYIEGVVLPDFNYMFVDEDGQRNTPRVGFTLNGRYFCGNAVMIGIDNQGNDVPCTLDLDSVKANVAFNIPSLN